MMTNPRLLTFAVLGLAVVAVSAWFGWSMFGPDTSSASQSRLRFANVSIAQPPATFDHSGLRARATVLLTDKHDRPAGSPIIIVSGSASDQNIMIDATTGEVLTDTIGSQYRDEADAVIASIRLESEPAQVWPLADVPPPDTSISMMSMTFIQPDPASGIFVLPGSAFGLNSSGEFLFVHNGRSRMTVDGETGEISADRILPEDREAFERYAAQYAASVALDVAP